MQLKMRAPVWSFIGSRVIQALAMLALVIALTAPLDAHSARVQNAVVASPEDVGNIEPSECAPAEQPPDGQTPLSESGRARIVVRDGAISLDVRDCKLTQLLSLISTATNILITVSDSLQEQRVTLRSRPQPIEAAIRELLRNTDVFVLYTAQEKAEPRLAAVWVYPRGSTRDIAPVPAELWASTRELEHQFSERDPELRARAIEELIARTGAAALPRVLEALADGSADIRGRALDAALAANLDVPLYSLHTLAITDLSPEVRLRALQALENRRDAMWIIEAATADSDPNIRYEAQSMLRRLLQPPQ